MRNVIGQEEMQAAAEELLEKLIPQGKAQVVVLSGDLGSGKTTFAQALARALGVTEVVTSPTFIIERVYKLGEKGRGFARLIHIDAYRLESEHELEALGWGEMLEGPENLILIEWGERVPSLIPKDSIRITFSYVDEDTRTITYEH
jgi:tRNA threonylcarbamoyladenosine biosynthesis protein TsaE